MIDGEVVTVETNTLAASDASLCTN